jgi:hypothetical protein
MFNKLQHHLQVWYCVNVVTTDGSSTPTVTIYHGGMDYVVADTITIAQDD